MNRLLAVLFTYLFYCSALYGQECPVILQEDTTVYDVVQQMPEFPGGVQEMFKFVYTGLSVPTDPVEEGWLYRAVVSFVIEKDGTISNVEVVRPRNTGLEKELVRIVKTMPDWEPGKENNMPVRVKYSLPLHVHLR